MPGINLLIVIVAVCLKTAAGFSNGKVSQACGDMVPQHGHHSSSKPAPYNITVDKVTFSPGDHITVTLLVAMSGSAYFKGFLIEARDAQQPNGPAVGSFSLVNPSVSQLLQCGHTQASAVSHTGESKKTEVQVVWESPKNSPASVQFVATVVHKFKVYWVMIPGPVVSQSGATAVPTQPTTTAEPTTPSVLPSPLSSEGCGSRKSCLRDPVGCDPEMDPACFFLSFTTEGPTVLFELSGPADGYVSFSLSLDKWMGNDDAYLCVRNGDSVGINAAYVPGRSPPQLASENALSDMAWRLSDGVIQCSFRRDIVITQSHESRFSLDQRYYLFLAHGRAQDGYIHRHDRQPLISTYQKVITGPPEDIVGSRSPLLIKFHGVFMLIAWMSTVSTGVIIARHFKPAWPETTLFGHKVWFQVHRALMILTVLLTCVGFTLPFIYRGGWSKNAGSHPYLGCTVMALSVIQPIMALLRPAAGSSRRYIFNWMHLGTGTIAQILAVVAIFLGIKQQALLLPGPWSTAVLAGCVVWGVLVDLLLQFHGEGLCKRVNNGAEDKEEIMLGHTENERHIKFQVSRFKNIVLGVFLIGNVGFLVVLLSTIGGL